MQDKLILKLFSPTLNQIQMITNNFHYSGYERSLANCNKSRRELYCSRVTDLSSPKNVSQLTSDESP